MSGNDSVDLDEIEDLVLPAMRQIQPLRNQKNSGRARLQDIVYQALEDGRSVPWVHKFRDDITRVFECGPGEDLLQRCRDKDDELRQDLSNQNSDLVHEASVEKDKEENELWMKHRNMDKVNADEKAEQETGPDLPFVPQREKLPPRPCNLPSKPVQAGCESHWATSKTESGLSDSNEQSTAELDIAALKRVLRFLLPAVGTSLGSNPLLSLLCLDYVNQELSLDLSLEALWEAQLTSPNIIMFLCRCFNMSGNDSVDLDEIEDLVLPAMRQIQPLRNQKNSGRARLQDIVYQALEDGRSVPWVHKFRDDITRVFECGPGEDLLQRCRDKDDELRQDLSNQNSDLVHEASVEKYG
ncbi:hypothetical protein NW762_014491 [Fusarium torreyae]|uniref:Uncharacterized protein n=1 Tax=Fusarium torreyae TaxID=1237075 RepID=A0A9W8RJU9_9HYPO|nr:hypothetical protein NW762_014491 [Fusarium torreyae]